MLKIYDQHTLLLLLLYCYMQKYLVAPTARLYVKYLQVSQALWSSHTAVGGVCVHAHVLVHALWLLVHLHRASSQ